MKKTIILLLIAISLSSCKSKVEKEIEEYDLRKAKLRYLKDLLDTKEDLKYNRRLEIIDSLIQEEKIRINVNDN